MSGISRTAISEQNVDRELYLLRHAKSSWEDPLASDRERPLNSRGHEQALRIGTALSELLPAQMIYVSPARRAQQTLAGLQERWPALHKYEHQTIEALYTFSTSNIIAWLRTQDSSSQRLFLIGHNPGFTDLVNWVCATSVLTNLPTAGFVSLALSISSWVGLNPGCGYLQRRVFPKEL